jgi:farnesyl diphosphate synthase
MKVTLTTHLEQERSVAPTGYCQTQLTRLESALLHACLLGGKRIRPLLLWDVYHALGGESSTEALLGSMLACELIHTQSLVFDDLPCMDDDTLRRGHPTVHVAFDEATAVLVGDALACIAFSFLVEHSPKGEPSRLLTLVKELGLIASLRGLVNGQYVDMFSSQTQNNEADLRYIQRNKTGALLAFSFTAPAHLLGLPPSTIATLQALGQQFGLLFQLVDDVLDATASSNQLGKTANKDAETEKASFVTVLGLQEAQQRVHLLSSDIHTTLEALTHEGILQQPELLHHWLQLFQHRQH